MKTPWRFLIDLTSRGKHEAPLDQPLLPASASKPTDVDSQAEAPAPPANAVETRADAVSSASETIAAPAPKTRVKPLKRAKPIRAPAAPKNAIDADHDKSTRTAPLPDGVDDVASLDEEIKKLRSELAQKLYFQNAQLKKMLERFDVS